jgi:large subunit ribosomal protein L4e
LEEVPLVVSGIEGIKKTKEATAVLERLGAFEDVQKVKDTKRIRVGKGKARNRRHVLRKGPLIIFNEDNGIEQAFRNIPGVELCSVDRLNLLQLAPGGHMGRLIVWTDGAFQRLESLFGSLSKKSEEKHNYQPPRPLMNNADLARIINSEEVQKKLRPTVKQTKHVKHKKNPLKNLGAMVKLNPYAMTRKRNELLAQEARKEGRAQKVQKKRAMSKEKKKGIKQSGLDFYNSMKNDAYTFGKHGDARAPQEE